MFRYVPTLIIALALLGFCIWAVAWSLIAPITLSSIDHWMMRVPLFALTIGLLAAAFYLGTLHALETAWRTQIAIAAIIVACTIGYWYLLGGVALPLAEMALAVAGFHHKEDELREDEMLDDSPGG